MAFCLCRCFLILFSLGHCREDMMSHLKDCLVESPSMAGSSDGDNEVEGVKVRVIKTNCQEGSEDLTFQPIWLGPC